MLTVMGYFGKAAFWNTEVLARVWLGYLGPYSAFSSG